jgi:hypothetical protein
METTKMSLDLQLKGEKTKVTKIEKELDKIKIDKAKWETKAQAVEAELAVSCAAPFMMTFNNHG